MAGYSGTPLPKKLGFKENNRVALINAPADFVALLGELPDGVILQSGLTGKSLLDVIVLFVTRRSALEKNLSATRARMNPSAGLWIAWPKKSSGVATDITENTLRDVILPTGLVDNKVCAIDETWSGLRFVIRVALRHE